MQGLEQATARVLARTLHARLPVIHDLTAQIRLLDAAAECTTNIWRDFVFEEQRGLASVRTPTKLMEMATASRSRMMPSNPGSASWIR